MKKKTDIKNFENFNENSNISDIFSTSGGNKINRLKRIKEASVTDLVGGENLVWLMKKIIIEQDERIGELEFKVAEIRGEVEED